MAQNSSATREVFNQSPPYEDVDLFALDRPLVEAVAAHGGASAERELSDFGKHWGSAAMAAAAGSPTRTRRSCGLSMRAAIGGTRSSFIPPITS